MAATTVLWAPTSVQTRCQLLSTSFRKDATSCSDLLDASSQPCFLGSPRSMARLRGAPVPRHTPRPISAASTSASFATPFPGNFVAHVQQEGVKDLNEDDEDDDDVISSSSELLETFNSVMADVVDGQKYLKETGRTKARPMKRRSLVVCLAMGALQPYLSEVENRMGNLRRTTSSSLAKTCRLASQLSFGASRAVSYIADEQMRKSDADSHCVPAAA